MCKATGILSMSLLLFVAIGMFGCPAKPAFTKIQVRLKSSVDELSTSRIIPNICTFDNHDTIALTKNELTNDTVCWWYNDNLENYVEKSILLTVWVDSASSDSFSIVVDTLIVPAEQWIIYSLFIGKSPEYGLGQDVMKRFPLRGYIGDTLYLSRDISNVRPLM